MSKSSDVALQCLATAAASWGMPLGCATLEAISSYLAFVLKKNEEVNITADSNWDELVLKHAADGVFAASVLRPLLPPAPRLLDLGAGAGFIGIVLKLVWPEATVTLMESSLRKYRFLNAAASNTGLKGLHVLNRRAGAGAALTTYELGQDAVIERALAKLPEAIRLCGPMRGPQGLIAAFQSDEPNPANPALVKAMAAAKVTALKSYPYRRPQAERDLRLVLFGNTAL